MPLEFRSEDHSYWIGSRRLLGVTEVLDKCGLISEFAKDPRRAEEGLIAHQCLHLYAQGGLDFASIDPAVLGYVESGIKLLDHTKWIVRATERQCYDERLGIAGTFDLDTDTDQLGDYKTGAPAKVHEIQLGAYWYLNDARMGVKCHGIYLQEDGSIAKLKEYDHRAGWQAFLACLNFLRVKEKY